MVPFCANRSGLVSCCTRIAASHSSPQVHHRIMMPYRLLSAFLDANRTATAWIERRLPVHFRRNFRRMYEQAVASCANHAGNRVVIDVGGGKVCPYLHLLRDPSSLTLISVDVSFHELHQNADVALKVVADVTRSMPFQDH